jgi:hypothetical protein
LCHLLIDTLRPPADATQIFIERRKEGKEGEEENKGKGKK